MALIANHTQGSQSIITSRPPVWSKGTKLRSSVSFPLLGRTHKLASSKNVRQWSFHPIILRKGLCFKVSSFKGNSQIDEPEGTGTRFRSSQKSIQLSLSQQEREKIVAESPDMMTSSLSVASEDSEDTCSKSSAIKELFRKWLMLLQSQASSSSIDEVQIKGLEQSGTVKYEPEIRGEQTRTLLKAVFLHFWALDATIKLPLVIFPSFYLTVRVVYGIEVAKELTPLWVVGPLILVFYIMLVRGVCSLYVFCFKLSKRIILNLPSYYLFLHEGKLKAYLRAHLWKPVEDIKNMDHKEFLVQKLKQMMTWAMEKRLDYIESVWPYYCRTIRFLKRANLI